MLTAPARTPVTDFESALPEGARGTEFFMGLDSLIVAPLVSCVDQLLEAMLSISGVLQFHEEQVGLPSTPQHHHAIAAQLAVCSGDAAIEGDRFHGFAPQGNQVCADLVLVKPIGSPAESVGIAIGHAHTMGLR